MPVARTGRRRVAAAGGPPADATGFSERLLAVPRATVLAALRSTHPLPAPSVWPYAPKARRLAGSLAHLRALVWGDDPFAFGRIDDGELLTWGLAASAMRADPAWQSLVELTATVTAHLTYRAPYGPAEHTALYRGLGALQSAWADGRMEAHLASVLLDRQASDWVSDRNTPAERLHLLTVGSADVRQSVLLSIGAAPQGRVTSRPAARA